MNSEEINAAIAKLVQLREKVYALETGKVGDLDLSVDQKKLLNQQADVLKQALKDTADLVEVGVPIVEKPVDPIEATPVEGVKG